MVRVGAVQLQDIQGDIPSALAAISNSMIEADRKNVDIVCFPECFLQGYTLSKDETKDRALDLGSHQFKDILDRLAGHEVTIILGLIEKDGDGFYNTAVIIRRGKLLGKYRKTHLFEQNFQPGTQYPVFSSGGVKFGVNICYDARFPEGAKVLAEQGARVIFYPLNNRLPVEKAISYRNKHVPNLVERAKETGCWIVSSDVIAQDDSHIAYGYTTAVDPHGKVISQVKELETSMITVDLP